jgi:hypothetical protein
VTLGTALVNVVPFSEESLILGRFPGLSHLSDRFGQHADDDECGALVG